MYPLHLSDNERVAAFSFISRSGVKLDDRHFLDHPSSEYTWEEVHGRILLFAT